jgi:hypothetical protein
MSIRKGKATMAGHYALGIKGRAWAPRYNNAFTTFLGVRTECHLPRVGINWNQGTALKM